jgi:hypothetical protein
MQGNSAGMCCSGHELLLMVAEADLHAAPAAAVALLQLSPELMPVLLLQLLPLLM